MQNVGRWMWNVFPFKLNCVFKIIVRWRTQQREIKCFFFSTHQQSSTWKVQLVKKILLINSTPNWPLSFVPVKAACIIKLPIVIFLFSNCAQNYISFLKIMLPLFFNSRLQAINECVKMYDVSLTFSMFWYNLTIFILQHYTCFFLSYLLVARRYFVSYATAN